MNKKTTLPKLNEYIAQKEREEFLIVKAEIKKENQKEIEIKINDNPEIANNITERREISNPKTNSAKPENIRFPAGGLGVITKTPKKNYLITTLRISKSSFDNHLTSFTGLGSFSEITNPEKTALRKGLEDLIITTNKKIVVPSFEKNLSEKIDIESIVKDGASLYEETKTLPLIEKDAYVLNLPSEKKIKIDWQNNIYEYQGLIVRDHGTRGLDFIKVIVINFDEKISDINFLDGRIIGGKNLLKRNIYALELDENFNWTGKISFEWKWNNNIKKYKRKTIEENIKFPLTPILKKIVEELSNIKHK